MSTKAARFCVALAGACPLAFTSISHAQTSLHGSGSATVTWTDNAFNAPDRREPDGPGRTAAWTLALVPGVSLSHLAPSTEYVATYSHPIRLYLTHDQPVEESDVLSLAGSFALTERDELTISLLGSYARTSDALSIPSRRPSAAPAPSGTSRNVTIAAQEALSHALSETWSLEQNAAFDQAVPIFEPSDNPAYYTISTGLSLSHARPRDSYQLSVNGNYLGAASSLPAGVEEPLHWSGSLSAGWRHQLSQRLSSHIGGGTALALRENDRAVLAPTVAGSLEYAGNVWSESLTFSRTMAPDSLTGAVFLSDTLGFAAFGTFAPQTRLGARTNHSYSWNRIVGSETTTQSARVWISEAAVDWEAIPSSLGISLVYQHFVQIGRESNVDLPSLHRNQVMLVLGGQFPAGGIRVAREGSVQERSSERPMGGTPGALGSPSATVETRGGRDGSIDQSASPPDDTSGQ